MSKGAPCWLSETENSLQNHPQTLERHPLRRSAAIHANDHIKFKVYPLTFEPVIPKRSGWYVTRYTQPSLESAITTSRIYTSIFAPIYSSLTRQLYQFESFDYGEYRHDSAPSTLGVTSVGAIDPSIDKSINDFNQSSISCSCFVFLPRIDIIRACSAAD